jgi:Big-like domain-containing protein
VNRIALALAALLVAAVPAGITTSGATFVAATANPAASFATAADFNTVAVALTDPGTPLRGTVALSATAASDRGIASVRFQTSPAGAGTWTDACTDTVAPYTCSFDTTTVGDGLRDVRALALDSAGYSRTDSVSSRRIDNTAPATALTDPGTPLTGSKTLAGTASDAGSGLTSLNIQYRLSSGGSWTDVCQRTTSPASCSLNTATLADGLYDLRTIATDAAGNSASSAVSNRRVDNTAPTVAVVAPPSAVRGTVTLQSTSSDGNGSGITQIKYQFRPASTGTWVDACTTTGSPFTCSGDTATIPDGLYDVRAIATDGAGFTTTSAIVSGRIDNTAPTSATLTNPGSPLSGSVTLNGSAADAGSGIASVRVEYAPAGTTTWATACSDTTAPYSCSWATTGVTDGVYDLRSVATDLAGNTLASPTVTSRRVDNNAPTVTLNDPGSPLGGTVTVSATASDGGGIASVAIQRKLSTASTWTTTICTDTTSSYSCAWNTTGVADGNYDLRAIAVDNAGRSTTSAVVTARRVDNTAPTGSNVQVANGSGTAHKMDTGDTLTFTWSEQISPDSILSGWNGSSTTVTVHVTDNNSNDTLSIWDAANTTRLRITGASDLTLRADRTASAGAVFTATAVQSGASVTITLGALQSGTSKTNTKSSAMAWTPSTFATDLAGNAVSSSTVNESPFAGKDF